MKYFLAIILLFFIPIALALDVPDLEKAKATYNANLNNIPGFLKSILGTERINIYVTLEDASILKFQTVLDDGIISTLDYGELENATLVVRTNESVIRDIQNATQPASRLEKAISDKEIQIEPQGFTKKIKWSFTKAAIRVTGWFGGLFR